MRVISSARYVTVALAIAASACACAKVPMAAKEAKEAPMSNHAYQTHSADGFTYTTAPVEAKLGPHRFAFPANLYDDQMGPAIGGGLGLTFMWPDLQAAPPGSRRTRSMADHYRAIDVSITYIDAVPITELLDRQSSTESTTEEGSINREDPRRRLDLRVPGVESHGLTPYLIDEERMASFSAEYEKQYGAAATRGRNVDEEWYVARTPDGRLSTFIRCTPPENGLEGLVIEGKLLVPDSASQVSMCRHSFVDATNQLSIVIRYPRVLRGEWRSMEDAVRSTLSRYQQN